MFFKCRLFDIKNVRTFVIKMLGCETEEKHGILFYDNLPLPFGLVRGLGLGLGLGRVQCLP